jgi:hypothetical protein
MVKLSFTEGLPRLNSRGTEKRFFGFFASTFDDDEKCNPALTDKTVWRFKKRFLDLLFVSQPRELHGTPLLLVQKSRHSSLMVKHFRG